MATATSFAPVLRWILLPNRFVGGGSSTGTATARLSQGHAVLSLIAGCLLLPLFLSSPAWADLESGATAETQQSSPMLDVEPGVTYRAGARIRIPGTDWSFLVPTGWQSTRPEDSEMPFLMAEEGKGLGMIFPLTDVTRETVRDHLSQPLSLLHGLSFIPAGAEADTDLSIARSYQGEDLAGRALAVLGPGNTSVIYFLMGPPDEASGYQSVLEGLGQSTRFAASVSGRGAGL
ncbi:MAG: hypothetical protein AABZ34_15480 [Nitrospirota bacterium]